MKFTFFLTVLFSVVAAGAQDNMPAAVSLHFAPTPGDHLLLISTDNSTDLELPDDAPAPDASLEDRLSAAGKPRKQTVTQGEVGFDWKIEEPDADGNTVITVSYAYVRRVLTRNKQVKISFTNLTGEEVVDPGWTLVLDSRHAIVDSNALPPNWDQLPQIKASVDDLEWVRGVLNESLIDHPFTVVVSPRGKVVAVKGMDAIWDKFRERTGEKTAQADRPRLDSFIEAFFGEDNVTKTFTLNLLLPFPEQPARPAESWSDQCDFELSGIKLPITRKLQMDDLPDADGTVGLSGLFEYHFPERKDQMVINAKRQYLSVHANIDIATGMYRWLNYTGALEITGRDADAAGNARPAFYLNSQLSGSVKTRRLSWRDPADKNFSIYPGGDGAYQVRFASNWTPTAVDEKLNDAIISIFKQAKTDAQLTATVQPLSLSYQWDHPLEEAAAKLKQTLEVDGGAQVKINWSRLFETGSVHWVRFRMEITKKDRTQRIYWAQLGYATHGQYTFELTRSNPASKDANAEADAILDSITAKDPANSQER